MPETAGCTPAGIPLAEADRGPAAVRSAPAVEAADGPCPGAGPRGGRRRPDRAAAHAAGEWPSAWLLQVPNWQEGPQWIKVPQSQGHPQWKP